MTNSWRDALMMSVLLAGLAASTTAAAASGELPSSESPTMRAETPQPNLWFSVGLLAGPTRPDAEFSHYQWDTAARMAWGAQALVGTGRVAAGLRLWKTHSKQTIDLPSVSLAPAVRLTSLELLGRVRVATVLGNQAFATASVGRLALSYDPDQLSLDLGMGSPLVVDLAPVNTWATGVGAAVRRPISNALSLGVEVDTRFYALEAAHRHGYAITVGRESFGDWNARVELAWTNRRR